MPLPGRVLWNVTNELGRESRPRRPLRRQNLRCTLFGLEGHRRPAEGRWFRPKKIVASGLQWFGRLTQNEILGHFCTLEHQRHQLEGIRTLDVELIWQSDLTAIPQWSHFWKERLSFLAPPKIFSAKITRRPLTAILEKGSSCLFELRLKHTNVVRAFVFRWNVYNGAPLPGLFVFMNLLYEPSTNHNS